MGTGMTRDVIFSKRFYGVTGMILVPIFTVGFLPQSARNLSSHPQVFLVIALLSILFMLVSTLGWRYCLRRGMLTLMRVYFGVQLTLFFIMFAVEMETTGGSAGGSNIIILIVLQASVLPRRYGLIIVALILLMLIFVSIPYQSIPNIAGAVFSNTLLSVAVLLIGYLIVSEERARQTADEANNKLTAYALQAEALATANERNRLARDIHDNLGHYLSAVNMQIEASIAIVESDPERAVTTLRKAQKLAKDGLADIRRSVGALRADPTQERPLHEALTRLVEEGQADGLAVDYRIEGTIRPCPAEVEMALYRIAQEGLTNIRKHAQATRAILELRYEADNHVRLNVQDNGQGSAQAEDGFGLLGIRERVKLLGGKLTVHTARGQGFSLTVEIPA